MRKFWAKEHSRMAVFILGIILFAVVLLTYFFNSSMRATQDTYLETQTAEYENEIGSYYYGDYGIQYRPGQAVNAPLVIGVCFDNMQSDFQTELARQVTEEAKEYSMSVLLLDSANDVDAERYNINELVTRRVKAIVWSPVDKEEATPERIYGIKKFNIPVINICNPVDELASDMVDSFLVPDKDEYAKLLSTALEGILPDDENKNVLVLPGEGSLLFGMDASFLEQAVNTAGHFAWKQGDDGGPDCVFVAAPEAIDKALMLRAQSGCVVVCGYIDGRVSALIREGTVACAIAASPASISKNAAAFAASAINGVKTPVSVNNVLYIVNGANLLDSADTWYLAYEE